MKHLDPRVLLLLTTLLVPAAGLAGGDALFLAGLRSGGDLDATTAYGVDVSFGRDDWPALLDVAFVRTDGESDLFLDLLVREVSFGAVRPLRRSGDGARPYLGLAISRLEVEAGGLFFAGASDESWGGTARAGAFWRRGSRFDVGLDARLTAAGSVDLLGDTIDPSSILLSVSLGWGW